MSGLAPILAGQYAVHYASHAKDFEQSLHRLTMLITFSGVMICTFFKWSNDYIEKTAGNASDVASDEKVQKKKKAKMTMTESARFLASSEYLRLIAVLVLGYGKSQLSLKFIYFHTTYSQN